MHSLSFAVLESVEESFQKEPFVRLPDTRPLNLICEPYSLNSLTLLTPLGGIRSKKSYGYN